MSSFDASYIVCTNKCLTQKTKPFDHLLYVCTVSPLTSTGFGHGQQRVARPMPSMLNPWRSERLVYRSIGAEDESFMTSAYEDPASRLNVTPWLAIPQSKKHVKDTIDWCQNKCMLGVLICLPAAPPSSDKETVSNAADAADANKLVPIGTMGLTALEPRMPQHRHAEIGINIIRAHQNRGYGGEAIRWVLEWGFRFGNLHRIQLGAFEWNPGAIR